MLLFWSFFCKQCSFIANHSKLPNSLNTSLANVYLQLFWSEDLGKIIRSLDLNKAHGHGNISIRMLKICGDTTCKPLEMIFNQALIFNEIIKFFWKKNLLRHTNPILNQVILVSNNWYQLPSKFTNPLMMGL